MSQPARVVVAAALFVLAALPSYGKCDQPTFTPLPEVVATDDPQSMATADFDKDGKLDLAISSPPNHQVKLFFGNGDGTFASGPTYPAGDSPYAVAVADFNGDGWTDLVVETGLNIGVLLNNGNGTFGAVVQTFPGIAAGQFAAGDVNGDGKADVAVSGVSGTPWINIVYGTGDGHFNPTVTTLTTNGRPKGIRLADFDGDGKLDVINSADSTTTQIEVWRNELPAGFTRIATQTVPNATLSDRISAADLNGDGRPDVAAITSSGFAVYRNNGSGGLTFVDKYLVNGDHSEMAVVDINEDGAVDIILPGLFTYFGQYLIGRGDGTFTPVLYSQPNSGWTSPMAGDFNRDGRPDYVALHPLSNTYEVQLNACAARYAKLVSTPYAEPSLYKDPVPFTITVTPRDPSLPVPTGTVALRGLVATLTPRGDGAHTATAVIVLEGLQLGDNPIEVTYSGDSEYDAASLSDTQTVVRRPFSTPTDFFVSGFPASGGQPGGILLRWTSSLGVDRHEVWRCENGIWSLYTPTTEETYTDTNVLPTKTYAYRVRSIGPNNSQTAFTEHAIGTSSPLANTATSGGPILASDLAALRTLTNQLRVAAGIPPITFTDPSLAGAVIKAVHLNELRSAIQSGRKTSVCPSGRMRRPSTEVACRPWARPTL